ncbi:hypothetical protein [Mannheimia pernigra]|uniref:hypothetical protein n=1 Tax=Mannheimia pernigra TaxID=111844 RepID=UPI00135CD782|nr:hypothetical protein [Mannheimia pernigra]
MVGCILQKFKLIGKRLRKLMSSLIQRLARYEKTADIAKNCLFLTACSKKSAPQ